MYNIWILMYCIEEFGDEWFVSFVDFGFDLGEREFEVSIEIGGRGGIGARRVGSVVWDG